MEAHERAAITCSKCQMEKPEGDFHIGSVWCKPCVSEYGKQRYRANAQRERDRKRAYRSVNKEKVVASVRDWAVRNADKISAYQRVYRKHYYAQPEKVAMRNMDASARRSAQSMATPAWADRKAMLAFYVRAKELSESTGQQYHVDHVVPILGRNVCGLHTEHNLQILSAVENSRKNNRLIDEIV